MKANKKFFKKSDMLPVDKFLFNVLYDKKIGYYSSKYPFGHKGDFITSPKISNLFSEMIGIWMVSTWENFGKPKNLNIIELGPGDGSLTKELIKIFKRFPEFNTSKNIFLYEVSKFLKNIQKKNIQDKKVKWINNFQKIKKGPTIFFGNEFFDAIPIKQFELKKNLFLEKYYRIDRKNKIKEVFKKAAKEDRKNILSYKTLRNLKFIEFPKIGLKELEKIVKKICKSSGCILMIDYGYLKPNNLNTLQSVMGHKKNFLLKNLGKADITSNVNFALLKEFFLKNRFKVKKIVSQKDFLKNMGIIERAEIISKKMKFTDQTNLYLRLKRLMSPRLMGEIFKVFLAYKINNNNFEGFK